MPSSWIGSCPGAMRWPERQAGRRCGTRLHAGDVRPDGQARVCPVQQSASGHHRRAQLRAHAGVSGRRVLPHRPELGDHSVNRPADLRPDQRATNRPTWPCSRARSAPVPWPSRPSTSPPAGPSIHSPTTRPSRRCPGLRGHRGPGVQGTGGQSHHRRCHPDHRAADPLGRGPPRLRGAAAPGSEGVDHREPERRAPAGAGLCRRRRGQRSGHRRRGQRRLSTSRSPRSRCWQ